MSLSHHRLATWYTLLAQQLEAGLPLIEALHGTRGGAPARLIDAMAGPLVGGATVDDALRAGARWLPQSDQFALSAASDAGRLPEMLRSLAERHAQLSTAHRRVALACIYPLLIVHLGLLLHPVIRMINWERGFEWSLLRYLGSLASTVGPLWVAIGAVYVLARRHNPALREVARRLPAIGGYVRAEELSQLAFVLGSFLEAGVPIGDAWSAAGIISCSPDLRRAAEQMAAVVAQGVAPGASLATWPCFPPDFIAQYRTGESTGQLDRALLRLSGQYQETANRSLTLATVLYPMLMFFAVAALVGYAVLSMYSGYLKTLEKLT